MNEHSKQCAGDGPDLSDTGPYASKDDATLAARGNMTVQAIRMQRACRDAQQAMDDVERESRMAQHDLADGSRYAHPFDGWIAACVGITVPQLRFARSLEEGIAHKAASERVYKVYPQRFMVMGDSTTIWVSDTGNRFQGVPQRVFFGWPMPSKDDAASCIQEIRPYTDKADAQAHADQLNATRPQRAADDPQFATSIANGWDFPLPSGLVESHEFYAREYGGYTGPRKEKA